MVSRKKRGSRGFTLIEIMLVVLIIGILSSLAIPGMFKMTARARRAEMSGALSKFRTYFINLYENQGNFCPPDQGTVCTNPGGSFLSVPNPTTGLLGQSAPWNPSVPGWISVPFYPDGSVQMRYVFTATTPSSGPATLQLTAYGLFPGYPILGTAQGLSYNYIYSETYQGVTINPSLTVDTPAF